MDPIMKHLSFQILLRYFFFLWRNTRPIRFACNSVRPDGNNERAVATPFPNPKGHARQEARSEEADKDSRVQCGGRQGFAGAVRRQTRIRRCSVHLHMCTSAVSLSHPDRWTTRTDKGFGDGSRTHRGLIEAESRTRPGTHPGLILDSSGTHLG